MYYLLCPLGSSLTTNFFSESISILVNPLISIPTPFSILNAISASMSLS